MYHVKMTPYEGEENYIFISYSHKDSETVWPMIDKLADKGFRVWYDDGISPGSEWPEYIAEHLNNSAVIVAFISPNSVESANCRREIHYALDKQKPFMYVLLEPTTLSAGLEMQLSTQNGIFRYNFPNEEKFFRKLLEADLLLPCIDPEAAELEKIRLERKEIEEKRRAIEERRKLEEDREKLAAEESALTGSTAAEPKANKKPEKQPTPRKNKKPLFIALASAAILIAAIAAGVLLLKPAGKSFQSPRNFYSVGDTIPSANPDFVGKWNYCSKEDETEKGYILSRYFMNSFFILPDGSLIFESANSPLSFHSFVNTPGLTFPIVSAENGKTDLVEKTLTFLADNGEADCANFRNLTVTCEFFDMKPEDYADKSYSDQLAYSETDGLRLHITGEYATSSLTSTPVDAVYVYRRSFDTAFFDNLLYGTWKDQVGNTWIFTREYVKKSNSLSAKAVLIEASGAEHAMKYHLFTQKQGEEFVYPGLLELGFDGMPVLRYRIADFSYTEIHFTSEQGDLTLTRVFD